MRPAKQAQFSASVISSIEVNASSPDDQEIVNMFGQSEVGEILLGVLRKGVLRIRAQGWDGSANRCAIEADHLHNLASLILKPNPRGLMYYFDVSRVDFMNRTADTSEFEADWNRLERIIQEIRKKSN